MNTNSPFFSKQSGFLFKLKSQKFDEFDVLVDFVRSWEEGNVEPYCSGLEFYGTNKGESSTINLNGVDVLISGWFIDCESG